MASGTKPVKMVKLSFKIPYFTQWGQSILVCGSEPMLGAWNVKKGLLLSPFHRSDELIWCGTVAVPSGFACEYSYYVVDDERNVLRWEAGKKRKLTLPDGITEGELVELRDLWQAASEALFFKSAFKDAIFQEGWNRDLGAQTGINNVTLDQQGSILVQFKISCARIRSDTSVYLTGSSVRLGQWKTEDGFKLSYVGKSFWQAECVLHKEEFPLKYKYCQRTEAGVIFLEAGPNRELVLDSLSESLPSCISLSDSVFRETHWRGAGVAIPMFSIRSTEDLGVGEFLDLKLLVDWAVESGFHLVQLLPVNDTSVHGMWWDSYPYSSLSVFALHPLYLRVQALSKNVSEEIKQEIRKAKEQLDKKDVDYEATMAAKLSISKRIFDAEKDTVLASASFQNFFSENEGADFKEGLLSYIRLVSELWFACRILLSYFRLVLEKVLLSN